MSRDQDLLKQLSRTRNLPTLPQVVHLALTHLDVNRNGALDVAAVIAEDPAMTARVLKVANSVLFNPSTDRVVSASDAIARVGFDEVRRIVITIGVIDGTKKPDATSTTSAIGGIALQLDCSQKLSQGLLLWRVPSPRFQSQNTFRPVYCTISGYSRWRPH